jgi:hypothetical protein
MLKINFSVFHARPILVYGETFLTFDHDGRCSPVFKLFIGVLSAVEVTLQRMDEKAIR